MAMPVQRYVYVFRLGEFHKIGQSEDVQARFANFSTLPYPAEIVHWFPSLHAFAVEKTLHRRFRSRRVRCEWFRLTPEDLALIRAVTSANAPEDLPPDLFVSTTKATLMVSMDADLKARLVRLAVHRGNTIGEEVEAALSSYLDQEEALQGLSLDAPPPLR